MVVNLRTLARDIELPIYRLARLPRTGEILIRPLARRPPTASSSQIEYKISVYRGEHRSHSEADINRTGTLPRPNVYSTRAPAIHWQHEISRSIVPNRPP